MTFLMVSFVAITPAVSESLSEKEIKKLALEAILENPQIVMDAVNLLRERDEANKESLKKQSYLDNKELLSSDPNAPTYGNPNADITIVEFFDYNCGYCKKSMDAVTELLRTEYDLKISFRDYPILSPSSRVAAKAALAAKEQGKYFVFHSALMNMQGNLNDKKIYSLASKLDIDIKKLKIDMQKASIEKVIEKNEILAKKLDIRGTPTFIINGKLYAGALELNKLRQIINNSLKKE